MYRPEFDNSFQYQSSQEQRSYQRSNSDSSFKASSSHNPYVQTGGYAGDSSNIRHSSSVNINSSYQRPGLDTVDSINLRYPANVNNTHLRPPSGVGAGARSSDQVIRRGQVVTPGSGQGERLSKSFRIRMEFIVCFLRLQPVFASSGLSV